MKYLVGIIISILLTGCAVSNKSLSKDFYIDGKVLSDVAPIYNSKNKETIYIGFNDCILEAKLEPNLSTSRVSLLNHKVSCDKSNYNEYRFLILDAKDFKEGIKTSVRPELKANIKLNTLQKIFLFEVKKDTKIKMLKIRK